MFAGDIDLKHNKTLEIPQKILEPVFLKWGKVQDAQWAQWTKKINKNKPPMILHTSMEIYAKQITRLYNWKWHRIKYLGLNFIKYVK